MSENYTESKVMIQTILEYTNGVRFYKRYTGLINKYDSDKWSSSTIDKATDFKTIDNAKEFIAENSIKDATIITMQITAEAR